VFLTGPLCCKGKPNDLFGEAVTTSPNHDRELCGAADEVAGWDGHPDNRQRFTIDIRETFDLSTLPRALPEGGRSAIGQIRTLRLPMSELG
jgi:hypothetical protein